MGLRFKGKNLAVDAHWLVRVDGDFHLLGILAKPSGNFAITLPRGALPVERDLVLPASAECMLILGGVPWTFRALTIHELRVVEDRISGRMSIELVRGVSDETETAVLTLRGERVTDTASLSTPAEDTEPAREDTFDLREGFGRMRWTDDRGALERHLSSATWRRAGSGTDAHGKRVRWGAGLEIPTFLMIFKGGPDTTLWFAAFVRFGRDKKVRTITLHPSEGVSAETAAEMLEWIVGKLGVAVPAWGKEDWTIQGIRVELELAQARFVVTLTATWA